MNVHHLRVTKPKKDPYAPVCDMEKGACVCRCKDQEVPDDAYDNLIFKTGAIGVANEQDVSISQCLDLCTHHPDCNAWEWHSPRGRHRVDGAEGVNGATCFMYSKVTRAVSNPQQSIMTTYIGYKKGYQVPGSTEEEDVFDSEIVDASSGQTKWKN
jgi:hypothetical protein